MFLLKRPFVYVVISTATCFAIFLVRCLTSTLVHNAWKVPWEKDLGVGHQYNEPNH